MPPGRWCLGWYCAAVERRGGRIGCRGGSCKHAIRTERSCCRRAPGAPRMLPTVPPVEERVTLHAMWRNSVRGTGAARKRQSALTTRALACGIDHVGCDGGKAIDGEHAIDLRK